MGLTTSATNWQHQATINGCTLGEPIKTTNPTTYEWDHPLLPNCTITDDRELVDPDGLPLEGVNIIWHDLPSVSAEESVES